jgi:hypothetical protein
LSDFNWPLWFSQGPADESFAERAAFVIDNTAIVAAPARDIYEVLDTGEKGSTWIPHFKDMEWRTPHRGVGGVADEHFSFMSIRLQMLVAEPGRRWLCSVNACTLPLATAMLEDVTFDEKPDGTTVVRWRVYYTPKALVRPLVPLVQPLFERLFRDATQNLKTYMETRAKAAG